MRSRYLFVAFFVFVAGLLPLSAGLTQLGSINNLANSRVSFDFGNFPVGASGGQLFRAWGLSIESANGELPIIGSDIVGGQPVSYLSNANDGASANLALIINLSRPARQMGFALRNGNQATMATVRVFDNLGNEIGQIPVNEVMSGLGPYVVFETDDPEETFTKVVIDYGASNRAEQIADFHVTFDQTPFFTSFLAQIGDGTFFGNFLQTSLVVTNLTNTTAMGQIRITGDDGVPLDMAFHDDDTGATLAPAGFGDVVLFPIPPLSTRSFTTDAQRSPPIQAWAEIRSSVPISTTAIFRAVVDGEPFEAGVGGDVPAHRLLAGVTRQAPDFDSGIAVANPTDEPAEAIVQLVSGGAVIATNTEFLVLGPGEHKSGFLPTLFPGIPENFQGSIVIISDVPLIATVLRTTKGGLVSASLPVGSTEN